VEKHFTLDNSLPGPDQKASLTPESFRLWVNAIREAEVMLGRPEKSVQAEELAHLSLVRKSVVMARAIAQGEVFTKAHLTLKRPGTGLPPSAYYDILGKKARESMDADDVVTEASVE